TETDGILTDIDYAQSSNASATFGASVKVNDGSPINWNTVSTDLIPNMGDYSALVSDGLNVYANWADGRQGTPDSWIAKITAGNAWTISAAARARGPAPHRGAP